MGISGNKMKLPLKQRIEIGYQNFCNKTSMHGFAELYSSYTLCWKLFWILICLGACSLTGYQICKSVNQYVNDPTSTTILSVSEEDMFYPALRLCYWQWFYWVDWHKVQSNGYPKDVLIYSFSFFNSIYTETPLNITVAKKQFEDVMRLRNFTTMTQFYNSIARPVPINDIDPSNLSHYFDETEVIYNYPRNTYMMFCYKVSGTNMFKYIFHSQNDKSISFETFDEVHENVKHFLTKAEYTQYILRWADRMGTYTIDRQQPMNLTTFAPPITILLFNYKMKGLEMVLDNDAYLISIRASVFTWLNKADRKCNKDYISTAFNSSCQDFCETVGTETECNCTRLDEAIRAGKDNSNNHICQKDINLILKPNKDAISENVSIQHYVEKEIQACTNVKKEIYDQCVAECVPACQNWNYEKSVTIKSTSNSLKQYGKKNATKIFIEYPRGQDVIIMTEINAQSWETFIGNVGGILGIWTGASVVSFIQLIYLCCIADHEDECLGFATTCSGNTNDVKALKHLQINQNAEAKSQNIVFSISRELEHSLI